MLAVAHDLAVTFHRPETTTEDIHFVILDFQDLGQFILGNRSALLGEELQNIFPARNGCSY